MSAITVSDVPDQARYEARSDGELVGWLEYTVAGRRLVLNHTEVPVEHEGKGVGGVLVREALDELRARPEPPELVPVCPFVAQWLMRHREYAPLVTPALRGQFEA